MMASARKSSGGLSNGIPTDDAARTTKGRAFFVKEAVVSLYRFYRSCTRPFLHWHPFFSIIC